MHIEQPQWKVIFNLFLCLLPPVELINFWCIYYVYVGLTAKISSGGILKKTLFNIAYKM